MLVSTQTDVLRRNYGDAKAIQMIKEAGFDAFDFSMFSIFSGNLEEPLTPNEPLNQADYREYALHLRAVADEVGIVCNQAHAPFPSSIGDPVIDEGIFGQIVRSMEIASILGAKIIVVHPYQHLSYAEHAQELLEMNIDFYRRLVPYCEKFGIKVATENMFQWDHEEDHALHSTCSQAEEFRQYLDMIGSPWIVGCLDLGHAGLVGEDVVHMIRTLGKERLCALHVHDNNMRYDLHTLPYTQGIRYDAVLSALKEIGYTGDFTYEADMFFAGFPQELYPQCLRFMQEVGRHMASKI